jgi:pimeloyl-ACP methyl ester carboxylesterase
VTLPSDQTDCPVLAANYPDRVSRLTLTGGPITSVVELFRRPIKVTRRAPKITLGVFLECATVPFGMPAWLLRAAQKRPWVRRLFYSHFTTHPFRIAPDLIGQLMIGLGAKGVFPTIRSGWIDYAYENLEQIKCPVLVIKGDHDELSTAWDLEAFISRVPEVRATIYADTGHWPQHERTAEFIADLTAFLDA